MNEALTGVVVTSVDPQLATAFVLFSNIFGIFSLVFYLFYSYCLYLLAEKLGEKNTWMAFIPVLNIILMFRMAKMSPWWILSIFVPLLNIYAFIVMIHRGISLRTGHGAGWTVGLIFLYLIFFPLTAFGYKPDQATPVAPAQI